MSDEQVPTPKLNWQEQLAAKIVENQFLTESFRQQMNNAFSNQLSGKKHATVESKVEELKERVGLNIYLQQKTAQEAQSTEIFARFSSQIKDKILQFIKNVIQSYYGSITVPAIQEEIINTFKTDGIQPQDVNNAAVAKMISDIILQEKSKYPQRNVDYQNMGKNLQTQNNDDPANSDFFHSIMPKNK